MWTNKAFYRYEHTFFKNTGIPPIFLARLTEAKIPFKIIRYTNAIKISYVCNIPQHEYVWGYLILPNIFVRQECLKDKDMEERLKLAHRMRYHDIIRKHNRGKC